MAVFLFPGEFKAVPNHVFKVHPAFGQLEPGKQAHIHVEFQLDSIAALQYKVCHHVLFQRISASCQSVLCLALRSSCVYMFANVHPCCCIYPCIW